MASTERYKMYGDLLFSHVTKGLTETAGEIPANCVNVGYNKLFSRDYLITYYQLRSFNEYCDEQLFSILRSSIKNMYGHKCYVDIITRNKPYKINWRSRALKDNRRSWRITRKKIRKTQVDESHEGYADFGVDEAVAADNKREYSWKYYTKASKTNEGTMLYSLVFRIKILKSDVNYLNDLFEVVNSVAKYLDIEVDLLKICMNDYVNETSPFKHSSTTFASNLICERTQATGITSKFLSTDQNRLPQGKEILGIDYYTKKHVSIDIRSEVISGASMFIVGESGAGKSTVLKHMNDNFNSSNIFIYLIDYEKDEYKAFGEKCGAKFLDLCGQGFYYEPLQLGNITGDKEIDSTIYPNAVDNYLHYITALHKKPLTTSQELILSEGILKTFSMYDVDPFDPSTWAGVKNVTMQSVYKVVRREKYSQENLKTYGKELTSLIDTLEIYFSPKSAKGNYFCNPISFDELKDEKVVITKFGRDSAGDLSEEESVPVKIKLISKMILDQDLARYRRSRNEVFATEYEEGQRFLKHAGASTMLNTTYTGIRKANGFAICVLNDPTLLKDEMLNLAINSKFFLIGATADLSTLDSLFRSSRLKGCENSIAKLSSIPNGFFINTPSYRSIFRVELPDYMINSPVYQTVSINS